MITLNRKQTNTLRGALFGVIKALPDTRTTAAKKKGAKRATHDDLVYATIARIEGIGAQRVKDLNAPLRAKRARAAAKPKKKKNAKRKTKNKPKRKSSAHKRIYAAAERAAKRGQKVGKRSPRQNRRVTRKGKKK